MAETTKIGIGLERGVLGQAGARSRLRLSLSTREAINGWLFAMPWIVGFLVFTAGPMLFSLYVSFTRYNIIREPRWVGLQNYTNIFTNDP